MRKLIIMLLLTMPAMATVNVNEINFNTVTSGTFDQSLRRWITTLNTDIVNAGGSPFQNRGTGQVFYVDSAVGSDSFTGTTPATATATLDAAVGLCTANRGDVIFVMQGHAETIDNGVSDAIDLDVAGITVTGLGVGSDMPEFLFDTTTDEIVINADGVTVSGLRFLAGVSEVANAIEIQALGDNATIVNCVFPEPTTAGFEFNIGIQLVTAGNYPVIAGNTFYSADQAGCESFIDGGAGVVIGWQVLGNFIHGSFDAAAIFSDQIDTELLIAGNSIVNLESADYCIELTAAATGIARDNAMQTNAIATAFNSGGLSCHNNTWLDTDSSNDEEAVVVNPLVDAVTNLFGVDNASNLGITTNVTADEDGSSLERLEYLQSLSNAILADLVAEGLDIGNVRYCDDGGSGTGGGVTWTTASATLDAAIGFSQANKNDIIFIGSNHNENLTGANAVDIDFAGLTIIGLGQGNQRPRFDFDDAAAEIVIGAAGVTLKNIQLMPGITEVLVGIDVENAGDYAVLENISFIDGEAAGTDEFIDGIVVGTTATNVIVRNCDYTSTETSGENDTFVNLDAATIANPAVEGCTVFADLNEAPIWFGAAVPTDVIFRNNTLTNLRSGEACIEGSGGATGIIENNHLVADTYGAVLLPGLARCYGNLQTVNTAAGAEDVPLIKGKSYARAMLTGDTNATDDLFDITGGQVIITSFLAKCTVAVGGATVMKINMVADDTFNYDISTSVDIDTVDAGGVLAFTAALGESVLTVNAVGASGSLGVPLQWWIEEGMLTSTLDSGGSTGDLEWYMIFTPVTDGVEVVPQ